MARIRARRRSAPDDAVRTQCMSRRGREQIREVNLRANQRRSMRTTRIICTMKRKKSNSNIPSRVKFQAGHRTAEVLLRDSRSRKVQAGIPLQISMVFAELSDGCNPSSSAGTLCRAHPSPASKQRTKVDVPLLHCRSLSSFGVKEIFLLPP